MYQTNKIHDTWSAANCGKHKIKNQNTWPFTAYRPRNMAPDNNSYN